MDAREAGWVARRLAAFSATRPGRWLSERFVWHVDPWLLRVTRNRVGLAWPLPTALLETRGARTGEPRSNGLIFFPDGAAKVVVASKAGAPRHPAWFHNLRAHPEDVRFAGAHVRVEVVEDEGERARLWSVADRVFPPFADYRREAAAHGREVPLVRLHPR